MSYFFPHATREDKRKETIKLFERHVLAMDKFQKRVGYEALENIPLCNQLLVALQDSKGKKLKFESWRDVYLKHGWTEVESNTKYVSRKSNLTTLSDVEEVIQGKKKVEFYGENEYVEGSENWTEFEYTVKGKTYRNTYPTDKRLIKVFYWAHWNNKHFTKRLELVKKSSFDIDLLELYEDTEIYIHEAFLIMLGVAPDPDQIKRKEFKLWIDASIFFDTKQFKDAPELNKDWFKKEYTEFNEWQILLRRFFKDKTLDDRRGLELEINTKDFIKWALKIGLIEEDTAHFRDGRKAPYEESFSKMLHKELLSKHLIKDGKHHHEWVWNTTVGNGLNSFTYLGKLLAKNRVPIKYWNQFERNTVSWKNLQHYIVGVNNPKSHLSEPNNLVVIEGIVQTMMADYENRPLTEFKYLDDED